MEQTPLVARRGTWRALLTHQHRLSLERKCTTGPGFAHRIRLSRARRGREAEEAQDLRLLSIQYSVMFVRGNGVIHRGQKPASRG